MVLYTIQSINFISSKTFQGFAWLGYLNHALYTVHWIINSTVRECFHLEPRKITLSENLTKNHPCAVKSNKSMCYTFKTGSEEKVRIKPPSQHSAICNNEYWRTERPGVNQHQRPSNIHQRNKPFCFSPVCNKQSTPILSHILLC